MDLEINDRLLYEVVKKSLSADLKARFSIVKTTTQGENGEVEIIPNTVTIKIDPCEAPKRDMSGNYYDFRKLVRINIFVDRGGGDIVDRGFEYCSEIKDSLNKLFRKTVDIKIKENEYSVFIRDCVMTQDSYHVGIDENGIHYFSLTYKIYY